MIQEQYVSFEIAKLLKEKGFDEPCHTWQRENENISYCDILLSSNDMSEKHNEYLVPTHQMAMKWLIANSNYEINVLCQTVEEDGIKTYGYDIFNCVDTKEKSYQGFGFSSREKACEAAVKYCLENLI